jgi:hypothetical protein
MTVLPHDPMQEVSARHGRRGNTARPKAMPALKRAEPGRLAVDGTLRFYPAVDVAASA